MAKLLERLFPYRKRQVLRSSQAGQQDIEPHHGAPATKQNTHGLSRFPMYVKLFYKWRYIFDYPSITHCQTHRYHMVLARGTQAWHRRKSREKRRLARAKQAHGQGQRDSGVKPIEALRRHGYIILSLVGWSR